MIIRGKNNVHGRMVGMSVERLIYIDYLIFCFQLKSSLHI